eukprot:CAMPEP_0204629946 /NCGR_PEP_ID=MMETSP0717-20131115/19271_1 /ASSEMBLY_ACC=CAM_ASM_000666 /TAXON_ID=230516 /ORGANISM="Chaetoceros curvisetus" /LENGTH=91 /DNA_ID=CAMNT_0051647031 /DNA_START=25 /DNA_END=300 /DNA_ORIENTATION=+
MAISTNAFAPSTPLNSLSSKTKSVPSISLNMGFGMGDEEPKKLTRENEPDEYFSSKMDEMSDAEKLPIALAGLGFISLPFIAGLIALYASK